MHVIIAALLVLTLAGCSFDPFKRKEESSPQDHAGCTVVKYNNPDGSMVDWWDCKDKSMVTATMTMPGGTSFSYNADDVTGFQHMRLRAEVDKALTASGAKVTCDMIDAVIGVLKANPIP